MNPHNPSTAGPSRSQASPSAALQRTPGRRPLLDDDKRTQILAILTNGSSRRIAAHYVGCSPGTITHTAQRDPQFADQLARAEQTAEIELLRSIRNAARQEKYWRAAAWLLERRNPADFALRPPQTFTAEQFEAQVAAMAKLILDLLPPDWQAKILQELDPAIAHFSTPALSNRANVYSEPQAQVLKLPGLAAAPPAAANLNTTKACSKMGLVQERVAASRSRLPSGI